MHADSPDLLIAKRLLDHLKVLGFQFQRTALGEDGPLLGYRMSDDYLDLIHIEGFSRDCFAWRKRASSLIVPGGGLVERRTDGSALNVLYGLRGRGDRAVSTRRARAYDRWRDVDGTHIPVGARVEQAEVDARMGAPRSRLHRRGQVTSRGATRLRVRFDGEDQPISIRPHLVRVVPL